MLRHIWRNVVHDDVPITGILAILPLRQVEISIGVAQMMASESSEIWNILAISDWIVKMYRTWYYS